MPFVTSSLRVAAHGKPVEASYSLLEIDTQQYFTKFPDDFCYGNACQGECCRGGAIVECCYTVFRQNEPMKRKAHI